MQVNSTHPGYTPAATPREDLVDPGWSAPGQLQVRTWLGDHLITDFTGPERDARRHVEAVTQLLSGLRLTVASADARTAGDR